MSLDITLDDKPVGLKTFTFSGGEVQVRLDLAPDEIIAFHRIDITAHIWSSDDLMELLLIANAIRRLYPSVTISLTLPYLPYARQDRACHRGEAFALDTLADLLKLGKFHPITVWDVHSEVAKDLIPGLVNVPAVEFVRHLPLASNSTVVVAPDKGAKKRAAACADELYCPLVLATKSRNADDGSLADPQVNTPHIGAMDFLIVDDICDGGRTFVNLARVLRPLTDGKILLYVTHGIFSNGYNDLREVIDHIYVANLHPQAGAPKDFVTVIQRGESR